KLGGGVVPIGMSLPVQEKRYLLSAFHRRGARAVLPGHMLQEHRPRVAELDFEKSWRRAWLGYTNDGERAWNPQVHFTFDRQAFRFQFLVLQALEAKQIATQLFQQESQWIQGTIRLCSRLGHVGRRNVCAYRHTRGSAKLR